MLSIPKIPAGTLAEAAGALAVQPAHGIACVNWPEAFAYAPQAEFRIAHNGRTLFLQFRVEEDCTMAVVTQDNGEVWTDSAVEFFISFDERGYYNFEFTCIGKALLGFRKTKPDVTHASPEVMALIGRSASLGSECFAERHVDGGWTLDVAIPAEAFFAHDLPTLDGVGARANVYKCGDNLSKPHFLSWQPIDTPAPNFHVPQFFGKIRFEQ